MPRRVEATARLGWLLDGEFSVGPTGPNRRAADATVKVLREMQRFERVDQALVVGFTMLAESVDSDPTNAALWREYRAAEVALRSAGEDDNADPFAALAGRFATLGDAPDS